MKINRIITCKLFLASDRQFHPCLPRLIYSLLASSRPVVPAAGAGSPGVGLVFSWKEMKENSHWEPSIQSRLMCPSVVHSPFCSSRAANRSKCLPPRYRNENQILQNQVQRADRLIYVTFQSSTEFILSSFQSRPDLLAEGMTGNGYIRTCSFYELREGTLEMEAKIDK